MVVFSNNILNKVIEFDKGYLWCNYTATLLISLKRRECFFDFVNFDSIPGELRRILWRVNFYRFSQQQYISTLLLR